MYLNIEFFKNVLELILKICKFETFQTIFFSYENFESDNRYRIKVGARVELARVL